MEFQDVIRRRKMIRSYTEEPVGRETVDFILENAIRAPSAGFSQGWGFLVLAEPAERALFWKTNWPDREEDRRWSTMQNAPVIIIPLAHKQAYLDRYAEPDKGWEDKDEARWPVPFWLIDTSFAAENILLTVTDLGLGALFFGVDTPRIREAFGIPEAYEPIGAISIGHPAEYDRPSPSLKRGRRSIEEVVRRGRWS